MAALIYWEIKSVKASHQRLLVHPTDHAQWQHLAFQSIHPPARTAKDPGLGKCPQKAAAASGGQVNFLGFVPTSQTENAHLWVQQSVTKACKHINVVPIQDHKRLTFGIFR